MPNSGSSLSSVSQGHGNGEMIHTSPVGHFKRISPVSFAASYHFTYHSFFGWFGFDIGSCGFSATFGLRGRFLGGLLLQRLCVSARLARLLSDRWLLAQPFYCFQVSLSFMRDALCSVSCNCNFRRMTPSQESPMGSLCAVGNISRLLLSPYLGYRCGGYAHVVK